MLCDNVQYDGRGHLHFAGADVTELAATYGTPLYLMDEDRIIYNCKTYADAMKSEFGTGSFPIYAGKAAAFKAIYEIISHHGIAADVVSAGEIYTAAKAGFPMDEVFFHGNGKTDAEIDFALDMGVGFFIVDSLDELYAVNEAAKKFDVCQNILLRITPGIDPHTYEAVSTGKVDSKFGVAIETGQAMEFIRTALSLGSVSLRGYHCHVGSQVFDSDFDVYRDTAKIMLDFIIESREKLLYEPEYLNLGGGFGVRYVDTDPETDIKTQIKNLAGYMKDYASSLGIALPRILMEPGRSIVADAGMTLYSVSTVKRIPGYKNYVSVDGGMTDNPRYALYRSAYTVCTADKGNEKPDFLADIVGKCCESGDIIQPGVMLPSSVRRGDIISVLTTGAYNYSMASNYNRIPRPPVIIIKNGTPRVAVRRETPRDVAALDL